MFLYPFQIFALSKNKRLFNLKEPQRTVGIYDVDTYKYNEIKDISKRYNSDISILLGNILNDTKLICLDLDDCFDEQTGEMEEETKNFLKEFDNEEWEVSSSGTGIHIYILTKKDLPTFIVKDLEGCKSFECYTNKRHIVTTTFDFLKTNLKTGKHDVFLETLYNKVEQQKTRSNQFTKDVINVFNGKVIEGDVDQFINRELYKREPITDMYKLRGLGYKDPMIIECIDMEPSSVDQSAHDARLIRKLMYYTLSFDSAWELAKKTNYYKHKDDFHKKKFNSDRYKNRTRKLILGV